MQGESFISKNWQNLVWIAGLLFAAGGAWSEFKTLHTEINQLKIERQKEREQSEKEIDGIKDQLYKEIEQRVDDLEEWKAYEEGRQSVISKHEKD